MDNKPWFSLIRGWHYCDKLSTYIWVNYNISLTWILQKFGDDFPIKTMIPGSVAVRSWSIYPDLWNVYWIKIIRHMFVYMYGTVRMCVCTIQTWVWEKRLTPFPCDLGIGVANVLHHHHHWQGQYVATCLDNLWEFNNTLLKITISNSEIG